MGYSKRLASEFLRRRIESGWSQDDARQRSGLGSQNLISMLERNVPDKPSMQDLVALGKIYRMTPNEIAECAGWWAPDKKPEVSPELQELIRGLQDLTVYDRKQLIEMWRKLLQAFRVAQQQQDSIAAAGPSEK